MSRPVSLLWGALLWPALAALPAAALEIQERPYQYAADSVFFRTERTFVIGDFAPVRLPPPPAPVLAVRETRPPARLPFEPYGPLPIAEPEFTPTAPVDVPSACALAEVHFPLGSAKVSRVAAKELLRSVAAFASPGTPLEVRGFTCDLGSQALNDRLARKRAEAVARVLRKAGYQVAAVAGKGRSDYCTRDTAVRPVNRRVEIRPSEAGSRPTRSP